MSNLGSRRVESDLFHRNIELLTVLCLIDRLLRRTNHLDAVLLENALGIQLERTVKRCLSAHGGQQSAWTFFLNNLCDRLPLNRLDVG